MPVLTYVNPIDFDSIDAAFTIDNDFLQMGGLDRDDRALYESILSGTQVGFFENNRQIAVVQVAESYDATNGIALESTPALTVGGGYHVRFTQARPGKTIYPFSGTLEDPYVDDLKEVYVAELVPFHSELDPFHSGLAPSFTDRLGEPVGDEGFTVGIQPMATTFLERREVSGSGDAIRLSPQPPFGALTNGLAFAFLPLSTNATTSVTADVSGLGDKLLRESDGTAIAINAITPGVPLAIEYNLGADEFWIKRDGERFTTAEKSKLGSLLTADAPNVLAAVQAMTPEQLTAVNAALRGLTVNAPATLQYSNTTRNLRTLTTGAWRNGFYYNNNIYVNISLTQGYSFSTTTFTQNEGGWAETPTQNRGADWNSGVSQTWTVYHSSLNIRRYPNPLSSSVLGTHALDSNNTHPRGAVYVANVNEFWVIDDIGRKFYRYSGTDASYIGTYDLNANSGSAADATYVSDLQEVWVIDVADNQIYRYTTTGDFLGVYSLTSDNADPVGIIYVTPTAKVWVMDDADNRAYIYNTIAA